MKEQWQVYANKVNAMEAREKWLLLLAAIAVVYLIWDGLFLEPLLAEEKQIGNQILAVEQQLNTYQQEEAMLLQALGSDPDAGQKKVIENLNRQLQRLNQELSALSVGLVPVVELPQILRDVLVRTRGLKLMGMETLPVEELQFSQQKEGGETETTGVFKHTIVVFLKGSYFRVVEYLAALENLGWKFYWDRLEYRVDSYPQGLIELRVYTLSTEEGLLGV